MERLSMEKLRSPRRSSGSNFFYPESGNNSGSSTPYMSAPSSPGRGNYNYYYSAPPTPPRNRSDIDSLEAAVPFAWEDKPGTPKSPTSAAQGGDMKNSVDHLAALGFHFKSAPVSPSRDFDFMSGNVFQAVNHGDEFEFNSARMSDADSVVSAMSHADELFFQGQILPLKLPPRLQQQKSSLSLTLQLQDFSSPKSGDKIELSPRGTGAAVPVHQLHSPRTPKSGLSRPPAAAYGYPKSPRTPKFPFKFQSQDENNTPTKRLQPKPASTSTSSIRRTLKELLHLNTSKSPASSNSSGMKKQDSVNSSGTDSHKSSRSSSSSSQRFSDSRSSSVSSNKSSARSSFSSPKQASPGPYDFLHNYNRSYKASNADELRRRTFLPYKQGLLGCISCLTSDSFRELQRAT